MFRTLAQCVFLASWFVRLDCEVYQDRPKIKTQDGDLIIEPAYDKSIYLLPNGPQSSVFVGEVNILSSKAKQDNTQTSQSTNSDFEELLNGPDGIVQRLRRLELQKRTVTTNDLSLNSSLVWRRLNNLLRKVNSLQTQIDNLKVDSCRSNPCQHGGTCLNLVTGYHCLCPDNWEGRACDIDVNECRNFAGTDVGCQNGATCINKPGYYECMCRSGWYGLHCTRREKDCTGGNFEMCGHGKCIAQTTGSGITCLCDQGWTTNGTGVECLTDVNECAANQIPYCSVIPKVECINLPGSFRCGPCPAGYTGDGYACSDIDECTTIPNGGCSPLVSCQNTVGSRICGRCPPGYEGDGVICSYRGSCSINNGGCHPSAQCMDILSLGRGQTTCVCPRGMAGDGMGPQGCYMYFNNMTSSCEDSPCGAHGRCHELRTGYTCICERGYGGRHCDSPSSACAINPCFNNGICRPDDNDAGFRCECTAEYSGPLCQRLRNCGGVLDAEEGSIVYPLTNTTYNHNSRCAWVIHTLPDKVINVTFTRFSLEDHYDCAFDFLQIHDGRSSANQLIGRFCGNNFPNGGNIISNHNNLYLWFRSDGSIAKNGFALHWKSVDPVCGADVQITTHGHISSPGSPGKYPPNRDCYWHLNANAGKRIQLHFFALDIEKHPNCSYDYVAIYDGMHDTDPLLNKFCNSTQPPPVTSAGSQVMIHFHSDASGAGNGFQIAYATIEGVPGCGGFFTSDQGELVSPSFNGSYVENLQCDYSIKTSPGTKIKLHFIHFDLEQSARCRFDHLSIYDGSSEDSPLVGKFCGHTSPNTYISTSNNLYLIFKSDTSLTGVGFKILYESLCQTTLVGDSGVIKSPGYPFKYPVNIDCEYVIRTTPGKAIQLTFQDFSIEDNSDFDCTYDSVEIKDGPDVNSTVLGKYCGDAHRVPPLITSTHNYMHIRFRTDMSVTGTGFYANYTTVDVACGGVHTETTGIINFPPGDDTYENDQECTWILLAPEGMHIKVTWNRFDIERMPSCESDYLELIEIDDDNVQYSIGKYCGNKLPPVLTTSTRRLMLKFESDSSIRSAGFSASYSFLDTSHCGGSYHRPHGTLYSPGWPSRYPPDRDCVWVITVPQGQQVRLNITQFDLERPIRGKCNRGDYLEIRNGATEISPLIGQYCGRLQSKRIISWSNIVYLHFHTDFYLSGSGFQIEWSGSLTGCSGTLTTSSGTISSPNYPESYNENTVCFYKIVTSQGSRVRLSFTDLDLEQTPLCRDDYIEIFDGRDSDSSLLGKYCSMSPELSHIDSSSNSMFIKFRSDAYIGGKGFLLNYYTICNNNLTGRYGVIESPDYPNNYPTHLDCLWTITVPKGNRLNVTFSNFDIHRFNRVQSRPFAYSPHVGRIGPPSPFSTIVTTSTCTTDYLQWKEESERDFSEKFCGMTAPPKITTVSNSLQIKLVTGGIFTATGFRLEWVIDGCGGHIQKRAGQITLGRSIASGEALECEWLIETPMGTSVILVVTSLYISNEPNCTTDAIKIYNGQNSDAPLLTTACSPQVSSVQSTSNFMLVKFIKNSNLNGANFKASFSAGRLTCGGNIQALSGFIYSKNYPKNYDNDLDCSWSISVPPLHRIQINFIDFDLYSVRNRMNNNEQCGDFIAIYDGRSFISASSNHTYKICPNSNVTSIVSNSNRIAVKFQTDDTGTAKGFKANFSVTCGSLINAVIDGIISNDRYLGGSNASCVWTILASKLDQKISLTITHLSLPKDTVTNRTCPSSYLRVFDGDDLDAPLIDEYCGRKAPPMIVSRGSTLTVQLGTYADRIVGRFAAHYSPVNEACGGTLTSELGTIASPYYPRWYPNGADCVWVLNTSPGNRVALTFERFSLENSEGCDEDYLEIRENDGGGRLLGVYCGDNVPTNTTVASKLYIKFHSNDENSAAGFLLHYEFLHGNDFINMDSGEIASPLYPKPYQGSGEYSWRIQASGIQSLSIIVDTVEIHTYGDSCNNKVSIYNGYDETAPLLADLCGKVLGSTKAYQTYSNVAYIKFTMNDPDLEGMFHMRWQKYNKNDDITEDGKVNCGNNYTEIVTSTNPKEILSPGYPNSYDDDLNCEWTYEATTGRHLQLSFQNFELEETSNCFADYVSIYSADQVGQWKTVKEKLCENAMDTLYNASRYMKITFNTDTSVSRQGFRGTVKNMCGALLTDSSGEVGILWEDIFTAQTNKFRCEWTVKVRPGRQIELSFLRFNITNTGTDCLTSVSLRNGDSGEAPYLGDGQFCGYGHEKTSKMTTSGNALFISYATTLNYNRAATKFYSFKIFYEEKNVECGGTSELSSDESWEVINSPNYPSVPTPYSQCEWIFTGPPGEILKIDFIDRFDLDRSDDCVNEAVEIRDGSSGLAPLLGRFCADASQTVKTTGNAMYIKYETQLADPRNGFKANVSINVCGGTIVAGVGELTSPGYPHVNIPTQADCIWIIRGLPRLVYTITPKDIDIPESQTPCDTKVTIQEKILSTNATVILKEYCHDGRGDTSPVTTSGNEFQIIYHVGTASDWSAPQQHRGFKFSFNSSRPVCGGSIRTSEGSFSTPNYPLETALRYCQWNIMVPDRSRRITLEIEDLDATKHTIGIYNDLYTFESNIQMITAPSDINGTIYKSSGNKITIFVWLNSSTKTHRFKAKFSSNEAAICGSDLTGLSGELTSPAIDTTYSCEWRYTTEPFNTDETKYNSILVTASVNSSVAKNRCRYSDPKVTLTAPSGRGVVFVRDICGVTDVTYRVPSTALILKAVTSTRRPLYFHVTYKSQPCGGNIELGENPTDILNIPNDVDDTIDCAWLITVTNSARANIQTVGSFQYNCDDEYIIITSGLSQIASPIGTYCKDKTLNEPLLTNFRFIYVQYHAKSKNSSSIKLMASLAQGQCGGELSTYQTSFRSPNFPKNYDPNQECVWNIAADVGNRVSLKFVDRFAVEGQANCTKDAVIIYDWKNEQYQEIAKLCGRELPPVYNSTYNKMKVVLRTDATTNLDGFKAVWTSICGGSFTATEKEQYLYSPGYPRAYPSFSECHYNIRAPGDKTIYVRFKEFELEGTYPDCIFDNVSIGGFKEYTYNAFVYCGSEIPPLLTKYESVDIVFKSDRFVQRTGFKVTYGIYDCGGRITEPTLLSSHNGDLYEENMNCTWIIQAPPDKKVVLDFRYIDVEGNDDCSNDYVAFYDGAFIDSDKRLALMCGNITSPTTLASAAGKALLQFYTDSSVQSRGFKVQISFTYPEAAGCGGHIDLTQTPLKTLKSFLLSGKTVYESYLNCIWTITAPSDKVVSLVFTSFHVSPCRNVNQTAIGMSTCLCDFVEVKDGINPDSVQIGKYCGHTLPPTVLSSGNLMSLRLSTDGDIASSGFEATLSVRPSQCGQTRYRVTNQATRVRTPGFQAGEVPRGTYCVYHFDVDRDDYGSISLSFLNMDLRPATEVNGVQKCLSDKLTVTSHPAARNTSLGKDYILSHEVGSFFFSSNFYEDIDFFPPKIELCGSNKPSELYLSSSISVVLAVSPDADSLRHKGVEFEVALTGYCGRNYTGTQGKIQRLYERRNYDSMGDCYTLITAPLNHTISVYFIEYYDYTHMGEMDADSLVIYDGNSTSSPRLASMSGLGDSASPQFSTGRYMLLHTHDGGDSNRVFYDLNFITTDRGRGCGGRLANEMGRVTSPMYPEVYRNKSVCQWELETPVSTRLKLHFSTFDLGPSCDQNYVQLVDSAGAVFATYCAEQPADYTSANNYVKIVFYTTMNNAGRGWVANFVGAL